MSMRSRTWLLVLILACACSVSAGELAEKAAKFDRLVAAEHVDAERVTLGHQRPRVAVLHRQEPDQRRVERHRGERPDREPDRLVAVHAGDDRDPRREVPEDGPELLGVECGCGLRHTT